MLRTSEHRISFREAFSNPRSLVDELSKLGVEIREREQFMMEQFHRLREMGFSPEQSYRIMEAGNISQSVKATKWVVEVVMPVTNKNPDKALNLVHNLLQLVIGSGCHAHSMSSIKRYARDREVPLPEYKTRKDALVPFFKSAICALKSIKSQWFIERMHGRRARVVPLSPELQ